MMNKIFLPILALINLIPLHAQTEWNIDRAHSSVTFEVLYMTITDVSGKFHTFSGQVLSDQEDFSDARIEFSIDVGSINTENERRDNHLRSPDFFDAGKYPEITFKSNSFNKTEGRNYILIGDLTMHGVTKEISLNALFNGTARDFRGNTRAGFKVTGSLNREDFGLTWNRTLESGNLLVDDEVRIICQIQLVRSQ
jgi:polyisoprenoid-binding protein YceI